MDARVPLRDSIGVGDYLVYPNHGVCRVAAINDEPVAGTAVQCIVLQPLAGGTIKVPAAKATTNGLRSLVTPEVAEQALERLRQQPKPLSTSHNQQERVESYLLGTGGIDDLACLVRSLYPIIEQAKDSPSKKRLDRYTTARIRLVDELRLVLEQTAEQVEVLVTARLTEGQGSPRAAEIPAPEGVVKAQKPKGACPAAPPRRAPKAKASVTPARVTPALAPPPKPPAPTRAPLSSAASDQRALRNLTAKVEEQAHELILRDRRITALEVKLQEAEAAIASLTKELQEVATTTATPRCTLSPPPPHPVAAGGEDETPAPALKPPGPRWKKQGKYWQF